MPQFDREYEASKARETALERAIHARMLERLGAQQVDAEGSSQDPQTPETPDSPGASQGSAFGRGARGVKQGVALAGARLLDDALLGAQSLVTSVAGEGLAVLPEEGVAEPGLRKSLGAPEGKAGEVGESIGRGLAFVVPLTKALKGAGMASRALRGVTAGAGSAAIGFGDDDPTAARSLVDAGFDNPIFQALATNEGDPRWKRAAKHAAEDATLGLIFEGVTQAARLRTIWKSADDVIPADPKMADAGAEAVSNVIAARGAVDKVLEATEIIAKATEADETARQLRIATRPDGLDASALQIPALQQRLRAALRVGDEVVVGDNPTDLHLNVLEKLAARRGLASADELGDELVDLAEPGFVDLAAQVDPETGLAAGGFLTRDQAGQVARQELAGAVELPEEVATSARRLADGSISDALDEAQVALSHAERELEDLVVNSGVDPRVAEQMRQIIAKATPARLGDAGRELDRRLGDYATRAAAARRALADLGGKPPPPSSMNPFLNQLEATTEQAAAFKTALEEGAFRGSVEGPANVLAQIHDSTNFERIAEAGSVKETIAGLADMYGNMFRSMRVTDRETFEQTQAKGLRWIAEDAEQFGLEESQVISQLSEFASNIKDAAAQMYAMRTYEVALVKKVQALANADVGSNTMAAAEFLRHQTLLANLTDMRAGVASEFGRGLSQQRLGAASHGFDELLKLDGIKISKAEEIVNNAGGLDKVRELAAKFAHGATDLRTARKLANDPTRRRLVLNMALEQFITNLLSGPRTHLVNLFGNASAAMWLRADVGVEGRLLARATGDARLEKMGAAYTHGLIAGHRAALMGIDGFKSSPVAKALKSGQSAFGRTQYVSDLAQQELAISSKNMLKIADMSIEKGGVQAALGRLAKSTLEAKGGLGGRLVDGYGRYNAWPLKALAAGDELAKAINYHGALHARAFELAADLTPSGSMDDLILAQKGLIDDVANLETLAARALREPDNVELLRRVDAAADLNKLAHENAALGTFTKDAGRITRYIQEGRGKWPITRLILPFVQTPVNIFRFATIDKGPLGLAAAVMKEDFRAGGVKQAKVLANHAMGTSIFLGAIGLTYSGRLTGSGPTEPTARANWLADDHNVPYSLRVDVPGVGVVPFRISRGDPIALPMMLAADLTESFQGLDEGEEMNPIIGAAVAMFEASKDKTYFQGITDFVRAAEDPQNFGQNYTVRLLSNFAPQGALVRQVGQALDEIPEDAPIIGTLGEIAAGTKHLPNIDKTQGFAIQLADNLRQQMPEPISRAMSAAMNLVAESRIAAEKTPLLDMWGEPISYMPQFAAVPTADNVRQEVVRAGGFVSTKQGYSTLALDGRQTLRLTPEQMNAYVRYSFQPRGGKRTMKQAMAKAIFGTTDPAPDAEPRDAWARLTADDQKAKLEQIRGEFKKRGRNELRRRFPEIDQAYKAARAKLKEDRQKARQRQAQQQGGGALPGLLRNLTGQGQ